jgi:hypothetical protein
MRRLGAAEQLVRDAELVVVTIYPEAVTLAGLLASTSWMVAVDPDDRRTWEPFLAEARRRLDTRNPTSSASETRWSDGFAASVLTAGTFQTRTYPRTIRISTVLVSRPVLSQPSGEPRPSSEADAAVICCRHERW